MYSIFIAIGVGSVGEGDTVVGVGEEWRPAHVEEDAVDSCCHGLGRGGEGVL